MVAPRPVLPGRRAPALVALALAVAGCSSGPTMSVRSADGAPLPPPRPTPGELHWDDCGDAELDGLDGLDCATLSVPLDHAQPGGAHIEIALARLAASDEDERLGAILVNPGGPGGSGIEFVQALSLFVNETFGDELNDHFDLIGFDPRGVGESTPIECVDDDWVEDHLHMDITPDTPEEQALLDGADAEFAQACRRSLGEHVADYSTVATAHDMDLIRAALGDEQLSFLGVSYGTYLGGVYATLHPERVRAMVLDSAFSPVGDDPFEQLSTQIIGFEHAFDSWSAWCVEHAGCPLRGGSRDPGDRWDGLERRLDDRPLVVDGREVNQSVLLTATIASLYDEGTWPVLAQAVADGETATAVVCSAWPTSTTGARRTAATTTPTRPRS